MTFIDFHWFPLIAITVPRSMYVHIDYHWFIRLSLISLMLIDFIKFRLPFWFSFFYYCFFVDVHWCVLMPIICFIYLSLFVILHICNWFYWFQVFLLFFCYWCSLIFNCFHWFLIAVHHNILVSIDCFLCSYWSPLIFIDFRWFLWVRQSPLRWDTIAGGLSDPVTLPL